MRDYIQLLEDYWKETLDLVEVGLEFSQNLEWPHQGVFPAEQQKLPNT